MKRRNESNSPNYQNKLRMLVFLLMFFLVTVALIVRLGYIQLIKGNEYKKQAMENWARDITISAKRGTIYDSRGKKLAVSVNSSSVICMPEDVKKRSQQISLDMSKNDEGFLTSLLKSLNKSINNPKGDENESVKDIKTPEQTAKILSEILEMDYDEVLKKITSNTTYVVLKKWITDEQAQKIREQELNGIGVIDDNKRVYPYGNFASYILGFTNIDQKGQYGIESTYDDYLTGVPGRMVVNTDSYGRELPYGYNEYFESKDGLGVVLTIDETIQHFAEASADKASIDFNSKRATIVVMDTNNGDILAMTSKPDYDPNNPKKSLDETINVAWEQLQSEELQKAWFDMWRNPTVNDIYEPGSTFKLLTVAIALEENKANLNSTYYCDGYVRQIKGENIKCWRYNNPHLQQTLSQALQNSCNDALAEIGLDIGKEIFYKYLRAFGLKEKSGIKLNGEELGIVKNPVNMKDVDVVTQAFGHGVTLTPIQLVTAVSSISNGGNLMEPRIVKQLIDEDGNVVENFEPIIRRKVISEETSKIMLQLMKESAESGTKQAYRPGYRIGGKSGTAQKVVNGIYGANTYISSFVAAAPVDDPKVTVLVIVDEPDPSIAYYGSIVAGPIAADLTENILKYLEIEPIYTDEELGKVESQTIIVPSLIGTTIEEAGDTLENLGLRSNITMDIDPNSTVKKQFPQPGEKVVKNTVITLILN